MQGSVLLAACQHQICAMKIACWMNDGATVLNQDSLSSKRIIEQQLRATPYQTTSSRK